MDRDYQKYIDRATEEVLNPTFAVTKQYLAVNEVLFENGVPKVERVDLDYTDDLVSVYFKIKGQRYFLEIHLVKEPQIAIHFAYIQSANRTYFTATSEDLTFEELSSFLTLKPLRGWSKGALKKYGNIPYKFSRLSFEPIESEAYELNRQLKLLLTEIEKDAENVRRLADNVTAYAYISVCKHQYVGGNAGVHFDIETINRLAKLNLPVDIDTYIVGTPLKNDEDE